MSIGDLVVFEALVDRQVLSIGRGYSGFGEGLDRSHQDNTSQPQIGP